MLNTSAVGSPLMMGGPVTFFVMVNVTFALLVIALICLLVAS